MKAKISILFLFILLLLSGCGVANESVVREAESNPNDAKQYFNEQKESTVQPENNTISQQQQQQKNNAKETNVSRIYKIGQPIFVTQDEYGYSYKYHFVGFINNDTFVLSKRHGRDYPEYLYYINFDETGIFEIPETKSKLKITDHTTNTITLAPVE